jgi:hypothetical protein
MSDRPSRIEAASASLPTIGTVLVAAVGIVWALGEMIGDVRTDIALVKLQQSNLSVQMTDTRSAQSDVMTQVAEVSRRIQRIEVTQEVRDRARPTRDRVVRSANSAAGAAQPSGDEP